MLKDYAKKSDINSINSRLDKLESDFGEMSDKVEDLDKGNKRLTHKHKKWRPKWVQMQLIINEI